MKLPLLFKVYRRTLALTSYVLPSYIGVLHAKRFMTPTRHQRPEWEEKIIAGSEAKMFNAQIKSWHWGTSGPTILLVHGWDGRGSQLGFFVAPLVAAGFKVIAIDGPSHGDSPGNRTNLREFAEKMLAIQHELGELYGVIAHSFGCAATALATDYGLITQKIVLISSPCDLQDIFDRFSSFMQLSPKSKYYFQNFVETEARLIVKETKMHEMIARIPHPVMVIHDQDDPEIPYSDALKLTKNLAHVDLITTKGLGHRRILKAKQVVDNVIHFMGEY
ncbi:putative hydrolase [Legionella nautarum]|uniref:Putative hydrolase n=1 Tax=Legionella nautarum TaxID=45070 RepID=A0A0W0WLK1_9GAMM|nr:alpha/beta hydrolase [Legionella nautarum]KTD33211.1 putative hydrolase [Legionella nautarum]